jgi:four helix bundle protein
MGTKIRSFADLIAWQEGHKLVLGIYEITKTFPKEETFGLTSQMRRAAVAITSNICEGFGRKTFKEKLQFYYLAQGSINELRNQSIIAKDIKYLEGDVFMELDVQLNNVHKLLQGLISKSKENIKNSVHTFERT